CERFSPLVGLEEDDEPECLLLDVQGIGRLFGGEEQLCREAAAFFERQGYTVRGAITDTLGAAWALARYANPLPLGEGGSRSEAGKAGANAEREERAEGERRKEEEEQEEKQESVSRPRVGKKRTGDKRRALPRVKKEAAAPHISAAPAPPKCAVR